MKTNQPESESKNEPKVCGTCGAPLPQGVLEGMCPSCLLDQTFDTKDGTIDREKRIQIPSTEEVARLFPDLDSIDLIGSGGMGAVYKARQTALDRWVAVKLLSAEEVEGAEFHKRFNREAKALARLNHPNIVNVHDFGEKNGRFYFIMEYVDGANLRQLEKAGRLSPREALQIIPQICDALQYAHDEGVVHRDIKPENVLIDRKGRVKIADFGLAKMVGADAESHRITLDGVIMGTPHYMAPEQIESPLSVDHRADIYSLGVVFYEMLTGDLPLGKFSPPSRKVQVDIRLDEVVLKALENDPSLRYQRAGEVKTELESISTSNADADGATASTVEPRTGGDAAKKLYWAGIPVVTERNGEREVSYNGALLAVALAFASMAIAHGLVWWITGNAYADRFSSRVCGLVALLTVAVGIRRTLHTPPPRQITTEGGTVILSKQRTPAFRSVLPIAFILVFTLVWGVTYQPWIKPGIQSVFGLNSIQPARKDSRTGVWTASLDQGGAVELLALSNPDPGPGSWWRPDGKPVPDVGFTIDPVYPEAANGLLIKNMVLDLRDLPQGSSGPKIRMQPAAISYSMNREVYRKGKQADGGYLITAEIPMDLNRIQLEVGIGNGQWESVAKYAPQKQSSTTMRSKRFPGLQATIHHATDTLEGCQLTIGLEGKPDDCEYRVVSTDLSRATHDPYLSSGKPWASETVETWIYEFPNLKLKDIDEFVIQARPIQWFRFNGIKVEPSQAVAPSLPPRFGPAIELTSEIFDFDKALVDEFPLIDREPGANLFEGIDEEIAQFKAMGYDAIADAGELKTFDVVFALMEASDWDRISPRDFRRKFHSGQFLPKSFQPGEGETAPMTYGFRTRENGMGLIQILEIKRDRPEASIRLKRLETPTP